MASTHAPDAAWARISVDDAAAIFDGAPFRWWFAGGRALELHSGFSWRPIGDTDIGVIRSDAEATHRWLEDWDLRIASGGTLTPWGGERLTCIPAQNNVWARRPGEERWLLDLLFGDGDSSEWRYRRNPRIGRSWEDAVLYTSDELPYLAPDLQLLFKSKNPRTKDHLDAHVVVPRLSAEERTFLLETLAPDHPWQDLLERNATG